jgi:hypothetical protein
LTPKSNVNWKGWPTPAKEKLLERLRHQTAGIPLWQPLPGPQTLAYQTKADVTGYGGAAGGGKTDLALGLAITAHHKSLILRREAVHLRAVEDRARDILGDRGRFNQTLGIWRDLPGGRQIEFGGCKDPGDEHAYRGRPHDLLVFDEADQFEERMIRFITGWLRTTRRGQRCRLLLNFNPPATAEGEWLLSYFAPWLSYLDPQFQPAHPHPAAPGELRWYAVVDGKEVAWPNGKAFQHRQETIQPKSRTFIPARLMDNPHLLATGYGATLQAMPEPLRSQLLYGDFKIGREDDAWQVIPTDWVRVAQARWTEGPPPGARLDAIGIDVARGGPAQTVIAKRYGTWFAPLVKVSGRQTIDGPSVAALVYQEYVPGCAINIDIGATAGGGAYESLRCYRDISDPINPINNAQSVDMRDRSGKYRLVNVRAASYWKLRECLDPVHGENLALPPDSELLADLCAPRYKLTASGIQLEAKEDIVQRLGRSPDAADAVVLCNWWRGGPLNPHAFSGRAMMSFGESDV